MSVFGIPIMVREQVPSVPEFRNGRGVLLCIDDDRIVLEMLKAVLEKSGYSVLAAGGGSQGLTILVDHAIDLVILDWEMPEMNGRATASEIRRMNPKIPIIINSGSQMPEDAFKIADAFVPKGTQRKVLLTAISELIGRAAVL